jgi:hypothetical protein
VSDTRDRMKRADKPSAAKRAAGIAAGLNIVAVAASLAIAMGASNHVDPVTVIALVYSLLAALIIARQSNHTVGWLFLIIGFFSTVMSLGAALSGLERFSNFKLGLWLGNFLWIPVFLVPVTLVLQFFPDGRLPSRRWWPVTAATLVGMGGIAASLAFHPWPWFDADVLEANNPFGIAGSELFFESLFDIASIILGVGMVGSLVTVVVRFRRSQGIERTQMKWLVYSAVVGFVPLLLLPSASPIQQLFFTLLPIVFALAITIAILRYRLFDIDVIIRKTMVYAVITALLALAYFGIVFSLQRLFEAVSGQDSPVSIVMSTLMIAALFAPLRRRVQDFIDRRFYRRRYDAEKTLSTFSQFVRDETDLESLSAELLRVTKETMQPEQLSLWLALGSDQAETQ